ncbi:hypothetical protein [Mesorhizobium sp. M0816]|uniref:hypothetical protein n=1 Tax=Mesorhizobium sp. M0816 TaxID=2957006 RepID=UPI00333B31B1
MINIEAKELTDRFLLILIEAQAAFYGGTFSSLRSSTEPSAAARCRTAFVPSFIPSIAKFPVYYDPVGSCSFAPKGANLVPIWWIEPKKKCLANIEGLP